MSLTDGIHWVLVPMTVPASFRSKHYMATGTCAHGTSESGIIAPTAELIAAQVDGLAVVHRQNTRCACPHRELVIKTEEGEGANG